MPKERYLKQQKVANFPDLRTGEAELQRRIEELRKSVPGLPSGDARTKFPANRWAQILGPYLQKLNAMRVRQPLSKQEEKAEESDTSSGSDEEGGDLSSFGDDDLDVMELGDD